LLNRRQHFFFGRKALRGLLGHSRVADPHGVLSSTALHDLRFDADGLLDERRRTGSAWKIISNFAISDANRLHVFLRDVC
jgi:hypothetical protein